MVCFDSSTEDYVDNTLVSFKKMSCTLSFNKNCLSNSVLGFAEFLASASFHSTTIVSTSLGIMYRHYLRRSSWCGVLWPVKSLNWLENSLRGSTLVNKLTGLMYLRLVF